MHKSVDAIKCSSRDCLVISEINMCSVLIEHRQTPTYWIAPSLIENHRFGRVSTRDARKHTSTSIVFWAARQKPVIICYWVSACLCVFEFRHNPFALPYMDLILIAWLPELQMNELFDRLLKYGKPGPMLHRRMGKLIHNTDDGWPTIFKRRISRGS